MYKRQSLTFFANRFTDIISYAPNPTPPANPYYCGTYFNTDLARARGVNLSTELRLKRWLSIDGYYTHLATKVLQSNDTDPAYTTGAPLLRRPPNSGSIIVNVFYAKVNWNFIGYFTGPRSDVDFYTGQLASNPGYARFDMTASYNVTHGLSATARVMNLFNKQYQDALGYAALGQTYYFGLRYRFSGRN